LIGQLAKLLLQVVCLVFVVGVAVALLRFATGRRVDVRLAAAAVLGAFVLAFALADADGAGSALNQARDDSVGSRAGVEHCLTESFGGAPLVPERIPFLDWVRKRLPADAVYAVAPYIGEPDGWCLTLVLLPALPAGPGGTPGWTITMGTVPPSVQLAISRHEVSPQVFAPGYLLVRNEPS
jgi:hypothetical protein